MRTRARTASAGDHVVKLALLVSYAAGDDGGSEPPLKRARSSSTGLDNSSAALAAADSLDGTPASGLDCREETPGDWRGGEESRESRDAALNAELARYMIRTEPLGTDRNHQRYWYMHVSSICWAGLPEIHQQPLDCSL